MSEIKLGQEVKDKITGYIGITVSKTVFLNGCVRFGVQRRMVKGDKEQPQVELFDEPDLKVIGNGILAEEKVEEPKKHNHGDPNFRPTRIR